MYVQVKCVFIACINVIYCKESTGRSLHCNLSVGNVDRKQPKKICTTERKMDGFVGSYGLHCKMMKKWTGRHHADYVDSETQFVLFKIT